MLEIKRGVGLDKEMRLENFNNLLVLVNSILGSEWVAFLKSLRYDVRLDDNQYLGFINAPAAKNNHHNYMGRYRDWETDRKSTRLNSSHITRSRMPSSA